MLDATASRIANGKANSTSNANANVISIYIFVCGVLTVFLRLRSRQPQILIIIKIEAYMDCVFYTHTFTPLSITIYVTSSLWLLKNMVVKLYELLLSSLLLGLYHLSPILDCDRRSDVGLWMIGLNDCDA
uniref:Uncharacterized protein n=1 Tax=Glossina pallidipes TaxID=7398 RepID=A0A1B0AGM9_GLOPL